MTYPHDIISKQKSIFFFNHLKQSGRCSFRLCYFVCHAITPFLLKKKTTLLIVPFEFEENILPPRVTKLKPLSGNRF